MNKKIFLALIALHVCILLSSFPSFSQNVVVERESTEIIIGATEHAEEPKIAGIGGVTYPERIPESYVVPVYPKEAKEKKIGGVVITQIVVKKDGTVGEIEILRSPESKLGFEKSSIDAIKQWRYKPAMYKGEPVDVYLTIEITFEIKEEEQNEQDSQPQQEPLIAGVGDVTYPERLPGYYVKPTIPHYVRKAKIKERVILQIVVRKDGKVGDIKVLSAPVSESIVISSFKQAAIDVVKQWKYTPAIKDGNPVDVYMTVSIDFELP